MEQATCCWCDAPVPKAGDTCSFECYSVWYAWYEAQAHIVQGAKLAMLRECETPPNDIDSQPWYPAAREGKEA